MKNSFWTPKGKKWAGVMISLVSSRRIFLALCQYLTPRIPWLWISFINRFNARKDIVTSNLRVKIHRCVMGGKSGSCTSLRFGRNREESAKKKKKPNQNKTKQKDTIIQRIKESTGKIPLCLGWPFLLRLPSLGQMTLLLCSPQHSSCSLMMAILNMKGLSLSSSELFTLEIHLSLQY